MFNRKKIEELELRIWALENPCKFKVGQKIANNGVVIKTEVQYHWIEGFHWMVTYFCDKEILCRREWMIIDLKSKTNKNK